jgi:oligopeptide transport system substrate-binding protein
MGKYLRQHFVHFCLALAAVGGCSYGLSQQQLVYNLSTEPRSLDPAIANGVPEAHVILNLIEGLTRTDADGKPRPAIAQKWEISPDQLTYTFHLREAKWSNGEPVTADDFVYGWRRALAPETAGEYAYQLFFVKGAEDFNARKTTDPQSIAVKAVDARTLEVKLRAPTPFFLSVLAHYAYSPLKESWIKAHPDWSTKPSEYLCDGPFTLAEWRHNDRLILKKNPSYYNAAAVNLSSVLMRMITNDSTALLEFEAGKIDLTYSVPLPDLPRLKQQGLLKTAPHLGTYYIAVANQKKPLNDARVRKALALTINRRQITDAILRSGQKPALAFVPPGITMNGKDFRDSAGDLFREDVAKGQKLLAEAGYPKGRGFPKLKYLYNDNEGHRTIAQALQNMWQTNLGIQIDLDVQEWKVYSQNKQKHNFQLARAGWIADYYDPVNFLDMYHTGAGNNDIDYSNPEYDRLVHESQVTTDTVKRTKLLHQAERKLIADDMAVIPIYFYKLNYLEKPYVKGLVMNALGYMYFDGVKIQRK